MGAAVVGSICFVGDVANAIAKAVDKRAAGSISSLFGGEGGGDQPQAAAPPQAAPPASGARFTGKRPAAPPVPAAPSAPSVPTMNAGLGGLFDETVHPRAGAGTTVMNPETGEVITGGEFAPNPLAEAPEAPPAGGEGTPPEGAPVRFRDKLTAAAASRKRAGQQDTLTGDLFHDADAVGTRVPGQPGAGGPASVPGTTGEGRTDPLGAGGAGGGQGDGRDARGAGDAAGNGAGDGAPGVHPGADAGAAGGGRDGGGDRDDADAGVKEPDPDDFEREVGPGELGTSVGVGFDSPVKTGTDFRISDADGIGDGNAREKFEANLAALRVLAELQPIENGVRAAAPVRPATPEEQAILARYSGWGWGSEVAFNPYHAGFGSYGSEGMKANQARQEELKSLMTRKEYDEARASTDNAHYTSPAVIRGVWEAVRRLGFDGGTWLEPAAGAGHFCGCQPADLWAKSSAVMVEIDPLSAAITANLYQSAKVYATGFQSAPLPGNYFDLAISNVPFGNVKLFDAEFNDSGRRWLCSRIHDYFFAKALDKVRPGGVLAFITSTGTMDKQDDAVRRYLADRADLVGAIRLPKNTFAGNAGTDVTTDVVFLRKRLPGEEAGGEPWMGLTTVVGKDDAAIPVNEYFARHPEMMLGQMALSGTRYRAGMPELVGDGRDIAAAIAEAARRLPEGVLTPRNGSGPDAPPAAPVGEALDPDEEAKWGHVRPGSFFVNESGVLMKRDWRRLGGGAEAAPVDLPMSAQKQVRSYVRVRDAMHKAFDAMLDPDAGDGDVIEAQSMLSKHYDAFVSAHGFLHARANVKALAEDPDLGTVLGLEKWDKKKQYGTKTDIFTRRTMMPPKGVTRVDTPEDAINVSLSERGALDWDRMGELTRMNPETLKAHFLDKGLVFENPEGGWETHDSYLSGNVRKKLKAAQAAAAIHPKWQRNVDALLPHVPADLEPGQVRGNLGASWIPPEDIAQFATEVFEIKNATARATYDPHTATWHVNHKDMKWESGALAWGAGGKHGGYLLWCALNDKYPVIKSRVTGADGKEREEVNQESTDAIREKIGEIREKFSQWLWTDPERTKRLLDVYNDRFNGHRLREWDGNHLKLPGLSVFGQQNIRKFVRDMVWRIIQSPSTLLAHEVGSGKSWCFSAACMEMRRLSVAKKPMIVVPNDLTASQQTEFLKMYPSAKLLVADPDDLSGPQARQQFLARAAGGDWDAIVVPQSVFTMIPMSREAQIAHLSEQIEEMDRAIDAALAESEGKTRSERDEDPTVKDLSKVRDSWVAAVEELQHQMEQHKDEGLTFERLGVDALLVDEAHFFKNLPIPTRLQRVKGINTVASSSQRANDMEMKVRHVQKMGNGGRVVMASGTPISNTMAELYVFQKYLDPDGLKASHIEHFDAWAKNFGMVQRELEYTATGGMKEVDRFSRYVNVGDLVKMFHRFADVKSRDDLGIAGPKVNFKTVVCPQSEGQSRYVQMLAVRAKSYRPRDPDSRRRDNPLVINTLGKKNSIDFRLVSPGADDDPESKLNKAVANLLEEYHGSSDRLGTQLVFLDMGTPKKEGAGRRRKGGASSAPDSGAVPDADDAEAAERGETAEDMARSARLYDDIKAKLVAKGVPAHEIAFIQDVGGNDEKRELQDAVNAGRIRILLGSRKKMAQGLNVQQRGVAIHDIDVPDTPASLNQGQGRFDRPGNTNPEINIYRYVTQAPGVEGTCSYDAVSWDRLKRKNSFIHQVMRGDPNVREMEEESVDALNAAEWAAIAANNPALFEYSKLKAEVDRMRSSLMGYQQDQYRLQGRVTQYHKRMGDIRGKLPYLERLAQWRHDNAPEKFSATLTSGQVIEKPGEFGDYLLARAAKLHGTIGESEQIGHYGGFKIAMTTDSKGEPYLEVSPAWGEAERGDAGEDATLRSSINMDSAQGTMASLRNALNEPDKRRKMLADELEQLPSDIATVQGQLKEWPKQAEFAEKMKRMAALQHSLSGKDAEAKDGKGGGATPAAAPGAAAAPPAVSDANYAPGENPLENPVEPVEKGMSYVGGVWHGDAPGVGVIGRFKERVRRGAGSAVAGLDAPGLPGVLRREGAVYRSGTVGTSDGSPYGHQEHAHTVSAPDSQKAARSVGLHLEGQGWTVHGVLRHADRALTNVGSGGPARLDRHARHVLVASDRQGNTHRFEIDSRPWLGRGKGGAEGEATAPADAAPSPAASAAPPPSGPRQRRRPLSLDPPEGRTNNVAQPDNSAHTPHTPPVAGWPESPVRAAAERHGLRLHDHAIQPEGAHEHHAYLMTHSNPARAVDRLYRHLEGQGYTLSPVTYHRKQVDEKKKHLYGFTARGADGSFHSFHILRPRDEGTATVPKTQVKEPKKRRRRGLGAVTHIKFGR